MWPATSSGWTGVAAEAAAGGARLLICPEMFLTGYAIGPEARGERWPSRSTGRRRRGRPRSPRDRGMALLYGYPERGDGRPGLQCGPAARPRRAAAAPTTARRICSATSTATPSRRARAPPTAGRAGRAAARHPDLLRCRVPGERPPAGVGRGPTASRCRPPTWCPTLSSPAAWCRRGPTRTRSFWPTPTAAGARASSSISALSCIVGPDGADLARAGTGEELLAGRARPGPPARPRAASTPTSPTAGPSSTAASPPPGKPAMTAAHEPATGKSADPPAGHLFRPRLPVRLRRLDGASGGPRARCRPSGTAPRWRSSAPALPA